MITGRPLVSVNTLYGRLCTQLLRGHGQVVRPHRAADRGAGALPHLRQMGGCGRLGLGGGLGTGCPYLVERLGVEPAPGRGRAVPTRRQGAAHRAGVRPQLPARRWLQQYDAGRAVGLHEHYFE